MSAPTEIHSSAKVNLGLIITGRRPDGYHDLDMLVAFADVGDEITLTLAGADRFDVAGPMAAGLATDADNLVLQAVRGFRALTGRIEPLAVRLVKRLPVASGIGGGSADAAAALRLLARLNGLPLSHPALLAAAGRIGADVPVCLEARARVMRGIGE